jgi:hypothetical protein
MDEHTGTKPRRFRKGWIWFGIGAVAAFSIGLLVGLAILSHRIRPYVRQEAIRYLERRFDSTVELADLKINVPPLSPIKWTAHRGRGVLIRVEGTGLVMRHKGRTDVPPLFALRRFTFQIDLAALFEPHRSVRNVVLDGLQIHIPSRGDRPRLPRKDASWQGSTSVDEVVARDGDLVILPRDPSKAPLEFRVQYLHLEAAGARGDMKYDAVMTNPKPPGQVVSRGTFGPWDGEEPGNSPLGGHYIFSHADLSIFNDIAGILNSTGDFDGQLDSISAKGTAWVKDFRLKSAGNPVPLTAHYEAVVDGANGDTTLNPVKAILGKTSFTTSGAVIRNDLNGRHAITLDVSMPKGRIEDVLRLGMKGPPMMTGEIYLKSKITIPPETGTVHQKLLLEGQFRVERGQFLASKIQDQLDQLSRRGQGQPKNEEIDQVFSELKGGFRMDDQVVTFRNLSFMVPGALIDLNGNYDLGEDAIDMHGSLSLDARVSQTMSGWKRIVLKPADPFFSRNGAGTYLRIRIDGTSKSVHYGLDHGDKHRGEKDEGKNKDKSIAGARGPNR